MKYKLIATILLAYTSASAALLVSDSFNYASGVLTGQNGGTGFNSPWFEPAANPASTQVADPFTVTSSGLSGKNVPGGVSGGSLIQQTINSGITSYKAGRTFDATGVFVPGASIYYSFLFQQSANCPVDFALATDSVNGLLHGAGTKVGMNPGARARVNAGFYIPAGATPGIVLANTTYFVVGKIDFTGGTNATSTVWLFDANSLLTISTTADMDSLTLFKPVPSVSNDAASLHADAASMVWLATGLNTTGLNIFDELRVGTSLVDVVAVPEPSTFALIFGGSFVLFATMLRRRK